MSFWLNKDGAVVSTEKEKGSEGVEMLPAMSMDLAVIVLSVPWPMLVIWAVVSVWVHSPFGLTATWVLTFFICSLCSFLLKLFSH